MRPEKFAWRGLGYGALLASIVVAGGAVQSGCGGSDGEGGGSGGGSTGGGSSSGGDSSKGSGGKATGGGNGAGGGGQLDPSCNKKDVDPTTYPECTTCTGGRCVPKDFIGSSEFLDTCGSGGVCLPDAIVETKGNFAPRKCSSVLGNEGRCSSLCLPAARALSTILPQDVCAADERCAPCFNPNDGKPTGICDFGCDKGPTSDPVVFTTCCSGNGQCVPRDNIPGTAKDNLAAETCKDGSVCVPLKLVNDPTYKFPKCAATIIVPNFPPYEAGEGACIPACVVDATDVGPYVVQGTCDAASKCVPCNDPRTNQPSGACL